MAGPWGEGDLGWQEETQDYRKNFLLQNQALMSMLDRYMKDSQGQLSTAMAQRGLSESPIAVRENARLLEELMGRRTEGLNSNALQWAGLQDQSYQNTQDRKYGYRMEQLRPYLQAQYQPKEKSQLGAIAGGIVGNMIAPGMGGMIGSQIGGSIGGGGGGGSFTGGSNSIGGGYTGRRQSKYQFAF